jgi:hypothetical protein
MGASIEDTWLLIQQRTNGEDSFIRRHEWDYNIGFGNTSSNYWIGHDAIRAYIDDFARPARNGVMRIEATNWKNTKYVFEAPVSMAPPRQNSIKFGTPHAISNAAYDVTSSSKTIPFALAAYSNCSKLEKTCPWYYPSNPPCGSFFPNSKYCDTKAEKKPDGCMRWLGLKDGIILRHVRILVRRIDVPARLTGPD